MSDTGSWRSFHKAVRRATWGAELCANEFDVNLWPGLFNRINFECKKSGGQKNKRPAVNIGIQYQYLKEMKRKKENLAFEDAPSTTHS